MNKILSLIAILFVTTSSFTQSIKGKVISNKKVLLGVNILIKNTTKGTQTNANGTFEINNLSKGKYTLVVSMVGFKTKEVSFSFNNKEKYLPTIKLIESNNELSEVIIDGERSKTKRPSNSLRLKTEYLKLPQNIQVISDEVMESQMITNMLDAPFKNVSGVSNIEHWGHFANINMRGFRLPAFRNGVNIQDAWGPLSEDMFMVDKLEFVKGPSGFMMSAGEPGGFYNVVTKKPTAIKIGKISTLVGTQDTYRGAVDFGGKIGSSERFLYRVNAMYESRGTHREQQNPTTRFGFAPALSYQITSKTKFLAEYSFQKVKTYIGSAYVFNTPDKGYGSLDKNFSMIDKTFPESDIVEMSLLNRLTHNFNENWSVEGQYVMMNFDQEGASFWNSSISANGDAIRSANIWDAISEGDYFQIYLNGKFNTGAINHKVMAGFDFTEKRYWANFSENKPFNTPFNVNNSTYSSSPKITFNRNYNLKDSDPYYGNIIRSFYAQEEASFLDDKVRLTLAGRYTQLNPIGKERIEKITPRVGLSVDILPELTAYGLYDQSFLPNDVDPKDVKAGTEFDPIEGNIMETGLKSKLFNDKLRASFSYYQITKNNLPLAGAEINPLTAQPFLFPESEVTSKGFEFDLQGKVTDELSLILNYANTNVENTEGTRIAGHSKHITNGWLTYDFNENTKLKGFGVSLGYQYQVDRSTWAWAGAEQKSDLPDYTRLDAAITWKNNKIRIGLNVNNLLNEHLYSGANYGSYVYWQSEPGINGRLSLTYNLF